MLYAQKPPVVTTSVAVVLFEFVLEIVDQDNTYAAVSSSYWSNQEGRHENGSSELGAVGRIKKGCIYLSTFSMN